MAVFSAVEYSPADCSCGRSWKQGTWRTLCHSCSWSCAKMWLFASKCGAPTSHLRENTAERVNGCCRERVLWSTFALNPSLFGFWLLWQPTQTKNWSPSFQITLPSIPFFARHVQCLICTSSLKSLIISKSRAGNSTPYIQVSQHTP